MHGKKFLLSTSPGNLKGQFSTRLRKKIMKNCPFSAYFGPKSKNIFEILIFCARKAGMLKKTISRNCTLILKNDTSY
jgi:hypothetical protein